MTLQMPDWLVISFLFLFGASVGSFLNVVVYRLPRISYPEPYGLFREITLTIKGLSSPPSTCPGCNTRLSWRDNIPVLGWLALGGKCRYCRMRISARYPIVEFVTGSLFVMTFLLMFHFGLGPHGVEETSVNRFGETSVIDGALNLTRAWPLLGMYLLMIAALLAASLIDAEHYIIPLIIPWVLVVAGVVGHGLVDEPGRPGSLSPSAIGAAVAIAGLAGIIISNVLLSVGIFTRSFARGEPLLERDKQFQNSVTEATPAIVETGQIEQPLIAESDYTPRQIRREVMHEVVFLLPAIVLAALSVVLVLRVKTVADLAASLSTTPLVSGALGSTLGALVGGAVVWFTRILGSLGFGKEAMGMGDVHLMLGVGAILGAAPSLIAFFVAPFIGLPVAVALLLFSRQRQIPYGPYLAAGSVVMIFLQSILVDYYVIPIVQLTGG